jgi:hypothetical protein
MDSELLTCQVDIPSNADVAGTSLATQMSALVAAGARVIYMAVPGSLSTYVYNWAIKYNLTSPFGYQWVGNRDAMAGFSVFNVPNAQYNFNGMLFWTPGYGLDLNAVGYEQLESGPLLQLPDGGLDPIYSQTRSRDLFSLSFFEQMQFRLMQDSQNTLGLALKIVIGGGRTGNVKALTGLAYLSLTGAVTFFTITSGAMRFDINLDRQGFTGVFVQLRT